MYQEEAMRSRDFQGFDELIFVFAHHFSAKAMIGQ